MKILVVEDEPLLGKAIQDFLLAEGYLCEWVKDFNVGESRVTGYLYDCALIDITLPGGSGLDLVAELKQGNPRTGIIIISAKNSIQDKINGLDLGADDYITKPFHFAELNSRIKSVIRRRSFEGNREILLDNIKILPDSFEVFVDTTKINLTKKEFQLLLFFLSNKNRVLTKESIAEHLWGEEAEIAKSLDFIYSHVKNLRKKISEAGGELSIQSLYGMGYKFSSE